MVQLAATSPWPVLILWGVIALLARAAKKKAQAPRRTLTPGADESDGARVELGDALQRAMEKLRQAEREAQGRRTGGQTVRRTVTPPPSARPPARPSYRLVLEDHSSQSQETAPADFDYDDDAAQLEEKRVREAAETFERGAEDEPAPLARVRPSLSVVQPGVVSAPTVRRNTLARFADGSLRGAVVLSEILGRPVADR